MKKACGSTSSKDRISHLPEPLRTKIISFLPMEDAVRTSILSSLWRDVTAYLVNLEFNQIAFEEKNYNEDQFRTFVDRLLVSRDRVDVRRFSLFLDVKDEAFLIHIRAWILFALRNNVREFYLRDNNYDGEMSKLKFPDCFFQCCTLTDLSLGYLHLKVPANVWFPSLKSFKLVAVTVSDHKPTNPNIFSCCPVIENLTLIDCRLNHSRQPCTISSPNLRILKLLFLTSRTDIKIHAKNLQQIEYRGCELLTMSNETLSSLLRVNFKLAYIRGGFDWSKNSPLIGLRNVVRLSLRGLYTKAISRNPESLACIPTCASLKHLELGIFPLWEHVRVVILFLNTCTNLVTLCVSVQTTSKPTNMPNLQTDSQKTTSRYLTTVELKKFGGTNEELHIVRYLLENASILEKMKIDYLDSLKNDATSRLAVSDELLTITKASNRATVFFS